MSDSIVKDKMDTNNKTVANSSKLGGMLSGRINGNTALSNNPDKALDAMMRSTSPETRNSGELTFVPLDVLLPFPGHPFKLYQGAKLNELVESIKEIGVVNAIIIRKAIEQPNMFQILSGHNRANAAKLAGLKQIKAETIDVDDDTAALIVVDSNFKQREVLLPSERAFGFKMQLDALKRQGKRIDLSEDENKSLKARDIIGNQQGISGVQVFKYIRLTGLIAEFLEMLDAGKFSIKAGADLSYLSKDHQVLLNDYINKNNIQRLDNEKTSLLKDAAENNSLTLEKIAYIMGHKTALKSKSVSLGRSDLLKFFPSSMSNEEIIQKIFTLLEEGIN